MTHWLLDGTSPVEGVRVGDPLERLLEKRLTTFRTGAPVENRDYRRDGIYDRAADGSETLVERAQLMAELRQYGGHAFLDQISYQIVDGVIDRIWIRGPVLDQLAVQYETDIEKLAGQPVGRERERGRHVYHYPERALSLCWDDREDRLDYVRFGPVTWQPPRFDDRMVLSEWLAAIEVLGDDLASPSKHAVASGAVRRQRVFALLAAFQLGTPANFLAGHFLKGKPLDRYPLSAAAMRTHWGRELSWPDPIVFLFSSLMRYRMAAERLLRHWRGVIEAGHPGFLTAMAMSQESNRRLQESLVEIEALLVEMIAPDGQSLTSVPGWPDVDLLRILEDELY